MLRFVIQKIKNKKWLNLCLLVGIILLVAMFSCHPMLKRGAVNQLLQTMFVDYAEENEEYPAVFTRSGSYEKTDFGDSQAVLQRLDSYISKWTEYVELDTVSVQQCLRLNGTNGVSHLADKTRFLRVGYMTDMDSHIEIVRGNSLAQAKEQSESDGAIPCIVSESVMDAAGLVVGEYIEFNEDEQDNKPVYTLKIVGIFKEKTDGSNFWYHDAAYYEKTVFVEQEDFDALLAEYQEDTTTISYEQNLLLDYTQINCDNAVRYMHYIEAFEEADRSFTNNMSQTLQTYQAQQKTVQTILWVLELPCMVLLLLFIYMVSSQILSAEEGEIAVLRSRGVTKKQTILLYMMQSAILSLFGMVIGIGFGYLMCKLAASTDSFLEFAVKNTSLYEFDGRMVLYAFAACIIAICFMTIPVWRRAGITIVQQKGSSRYRRVRPFWETFFLDVILLGISIYLLYNYNKQSENLSFSVMNGGSLDPMIFLDASLFIFSCGLVFLRLMRYLVCLIDSLGKKHWNPAMYASFLQIRRTFTKQGFISVFLIMTIANGIFNANMARTMNQNNEERIAYNLGSDVVWSENWKMRLTKGSDNELYWSYEAPNDYEIYKECIEAGICESTTRVLIDENTRMTCSGKKIEGCTLMAVHTKEFGQTAELMDGLNETHWFYSLNALAQQTDGVIISRNLAEEAGLAVGDRINYARFNPMSSKSEEEINVVSATVCAIVDAFPGYNRYLYEQDADGNTVEKENYLLVANYATVVSEFGLTPYQIWMRLADGHSSEEIANYLLENGIGLSKWQALEEQITESRSSAVIQITNGMFTLSFFISMIICSVGFLIYWMMSIKNRELLFGIYRAMGMKMKEIRLMLVNEQIFSSILSIIAGGGVGALGTFLFVKLVALVYLPQKHNIPIHIYVYASDIIKLFAVVFVIVLLCIFVLRRMLQKMNIAQALKLGED